MIEEQFISLDTARMLKEVGFDVPCTSQYTENEFAWENLRKTDFNKSDYVFSRPTQALAARWLREVHGMFIEIFYRVTGFNYEIIGMGTNNVVYTPHEPKINFISYEGCLEDALQETVKLIKK